MCINLSAIVLSLKSLKLCPLIPQKQKTFEILAGIGIKSQSLEFLFLLPIEFWAILSELLKAALKQEVCRQSNRLSVENYGILLFLNIFATLKYEYFFNF